MALPVYADAAALAAYLGTDQSLPAGWDSDRVLRQASRVVDRMVTAPYATVSSSDLTPTLTAVVDAMEEAVCAIIEYWLAAGGEDVDRVVLGGTISFDQVSMDNPPTWLSPRAGEVLRQAGLRGEPGGN